MAVEGQLEPSTLLGTSDCLAPFPAVRWVTIEPAEVNPKGTGPVGPALRVYVIIPIGRLRPSRSAMRHDIGLQSNSE
jgi:hypothetical protein